MSSIEHKPLDQQVMVITGAASGIGLAIAEAAAKKGAKLVLVARNAQTLQDVAELIANDGGQALAVVADVSRRDEVEEVADEAIAAFGRIDTWVNDAGVSSYGRLDEASEDDSRRLFDINFWGVVNGSLVALSYLKEQGGALINVGSEVSENVIPMQGMYAASKQAVKGFTDALRVEIEHVDKAQISITLIQPTAIDTPSPRPGMPEPMIDPALVAGAVLRAATTAQPISRA